MTLPLPPLGHAVIISGPFSFFPYVCVRALVDGVSPLPFWNGSLDCNANPLGPSTPRWPPPNTHTHRQTHGLPHPSYSVAVCASERWPHWWQPAANRGSRLISDITVDVSIPIKPIRSEEKKKVYEIHYIVRAEYSKTNITFITGFIPSLFFSFTKTVSKATG